MKRQNGTESHGTGIFSVSERFYLTQQFLRVLKNTLYGDRTILRDLHFAVGSAKTFSFVTWNSNLRLSRVTLRCN